MLWFPVEGYILSGIYYLVGFCMLGLMIKKGMFLAVSFPNFYLPFLREEEFSSAYFYRAVSLVCLGMGWLVFYLVGVIGVWVFCLGGGEGCG